jgi:hypothetical protein
MTTSLIDSKLWVDDIRRPPDDSWVWARTNKEALLFLRSNFIVEVSLDHDMGLHGFDPDEQDADLRVAPDAHLQPDGMDLVREIVACKLLSPQTKITVHSWNPVGAENMAKELRAAGFTVAVDPFDLSIRKRHAA